MDWPTLQHKMYDVREELQIPHPYDRKRVESNMGAYTRDELRRLVEEYADHGYTMHVTDCGEWAVVVSGKLGRITLNLYLTPYEAEAPAEPEQTSSADEQQGIDLEPWYDRK